MNFRIIIKFFLDADNKKKENYLHVLRKTHHK